MSSNVSEFLNGNILSKYSKLTNEEFETQEKEEKYITPTGPICF